MYQRLESSSNKKIANATSNPPVINKVEEPSVSHSQDKLSMIDFNTKADPTASEKPIKYQARQLFFAAHQKKNSVELKAELYPENVVPKSYGKTIIDDVQYKKYYKMFENKEEKQVIKLMRHHISRITFDQFLARLNQCMDTKEDKTLTITDWKMPDFVSFPKFFMNGHTKQSFNEDTDPSPFLSQDEGFKPYG